MEHEKIMLSVCVVVYNHEGYIRECLDQLLRQKVNFPIEVLVGNDCSTDHSAQIIEEYYGNEVILINRKQNVGLCRNLYDLFWRANGKYVYLIAGDDYIKDEDTLQKQVDFLELHSDYFSASARNLNYSQATGMFTESRISWGDFTICDFLASGNIPCLYGTMRNIFRTDSENNGFLQTGARNNEEIKWWMYTMDKGKKYIFEDFMTVYRSVERTGGSNYNSTHSYMERFRDYYTDIKIVRRIYGKKYNLKPYRLSITNRYCLLTGTDFKSFIQFMRIMSFSDAVSFIIYKIYLRLHHYQMPDKWKSKAYLVR